MPTAGASGQTQEEIQLRLNELGMQHACNVERNMRERKRRKEYKRKERRAKKRREEKRTEERRGEERKAREKCGRTWRKGSGSTMITAHLLQYGFKSERQQGERVTKRRVKILR